MASSSVFELADAHKSNVWTKCLVEQNSDDSMFDSGEIYGNSSLTNNSVMDEINADNRLTELPSVKNNSKPSEEENQLYFKIYNKRRLSDSFPDFQHLVADSLTSTIVTKKLSKFLPLLLIQGLTKNHLTEKDLSSALQKECKEDVSNILQSLLTVMQVSINSPSKKQLTKNPLIEKDESPVPQKEYKEDVSNILQSLLTVMRASINSPSEKQTLEYCQTVLEETTAGVDDSSVIYYFLKNLLSCDPLLKQASIALLCSYCSERQFNLSLVRNLLKTLISLYSDEDLEVLESSWKTVNAIIQNLKHADQIKIVPDVCLAVKWAVFHLKDKKYLPGLCHSEGFDSIFPLYEKVMLKGIMKDKKLAAQALHQLIMFSSEDALQSSLCSLASVLICIILKFKDDPCVRTKIALVETLTTLLAKVGIKLKLYFTQIQSTFLTTMRSDNRALQMRCIRGLCCLVRFNDQLDTIFDTIFDSVRLEPFRIKKIMLVLLRHVVKCICVPLRDIWCCKLSVLVLSMLDFKNYGARVLASGCMGTMLGFLPYPECESLLKLYFLEDDQSQQWHLRHSKCSALMVAIKEYPEKFLRKEELSKKICAVLFRYMTLQKADIVISGITACGYFMLFKISLSEKINLALLIAFCEAINHNSEEVRRTFALVTSFLANRVALPLYVLRRIVPSLIKGTKDGHKEVKSSCEFALVAVLDLYTQDEITQMYLNTLESDAQETFQNLITNLKVLAKQPKPKEQELDFTITMT